MNDKQVDLVKNLLGEKFFEDLEKMEIQKLNTRTMVSPEEIKIALQIVPRSILSFLFSNLKDKKEGENIELVLPFENATMLLNKMGADNYNGEIVQQGKRICNFHNRSLPSLGLLLLTTFELYDTSMLDEIKHCKDDKSETLQMLIDQRMMMTSLISEVVDKKMAEREAIDRMVKQRMFNDMIMMDIKRNRDMEQSDKKSKLKQFLESREQKRQEPVELDKSEINCPDCGTTIYKGENHVKLCICYGDQMGKEIKIQKADNGKVKLKFPKSFDIENIEMLLDALKNK